MISKTTVEKKIIEIVDSACKGQTVTREELKKILYEFFNKIDFTDK